MSKPSSILVDGGNNQRAKECMEGNMKLEKQIKEVLALENVVDQISRTSDVTDPHKGKDNLRYFQLVLELRLQDHSLPLSRR
jgi:hypothetical protein